MNLLLITADQWRGDCSRSAWPSLPQDPASGRARRRRRAVQAALHPGDALRAGAGVAAHRHVCAEPSLGDQRHAAGRAAFRSRRRSAPRGLPADPVRLHRPERRPARPRSGRPVASDLRGAVPELRGRPLPARGQRRLARPPGAPPRPPPALWPSCSAAALGEPAPYPAEDSETAFLADAFLDLARAAGGRGALVRASELRQAAPAAGGARPLSRALSIRTRCRRRSGRRARRPRRRPIPGSRPSSRSR